MQRLAEQPVLGAVQRDAGLVAGSLDAQYPHRMSIARTLRRRRLRRPGAGRRRGARRSVRAILGRLDEPTFRCDRDRRRRRRAVLRIGRRTARPARGADRPLAATGREDSHLGRWPLQLHQLVGRPARALHRRRCALRAHRAARVRAGALRRPGAPPRHRFSREAQGPAVLRRQRRAHRGDAAHRMRTRRGRLVPPLQGRVGASSRRRRTRPAALRAAHRCGRAGRARTGGGHRWPVDPEDRRDRPRLPDRAAIRPARRRAAAGAGAADLRCRTAGRHSPNCRACRCR